MANAPIQLKKVTPGDVAAVPAGCVGFVAGSDGKFYAKDGSSAAVQLSTSEDVQAALATFENISRNAYSWPATKTYSNGRLATTVYTTNDGTITKTLNYDTSGAITSIVLSGDIPVGVPTTKTLTYANGLVTGQAYT